MILTKREYEEVVRSGRRYLKDEARRNKKMYDEIMYVASIEPIATLNYPRHADWYLLEYKEKSSMAVQDSMAFYYGDFPEDKGIPKHGEKISVVDKSGKELFSFEYNRYRAYAIFCDYFKDHVPNRYREEYLRMRDRMYQKAAAS